MKRIALLLALGGCVFGTEARVEETLDQGGIRVTPNTLRLQSLEEDVMIGGLAFYSSGNPFDTSPRGRTIDFEYAGHEISIGMGQVERMVVSGGESAIWVDGVSQVVTIETSNAGRGESDGYGYGYGREVLLSFTFRADEGPIDAELRLTADYHCPPFDDRPAEVEGAEAPNEFH